MKSVERVGRDRERGSSQSGVRSMHKYVNVRDHEIYIYMGLTGKNGMCIDNDFSAIICTN